MHFLMDIPAIALQLSIHKHVLQARSQGGAHEKHAGQWTYDIAYAV